MVARLLVSDSTLVEGRRLQVLTAILSPFTVPVSRCGLAVRRLAGKQKDLGSIHFGSPLSSEIVVYGQSCDFAHTINEILKWLTQLLTLM